MAEFDQQLMDLAVERALAVTRYADDIAFSGTAMFDIRREIAIVAQRHGHEVNANKTRTLKHGQPLYVTGLSVADRTGPRLPRQFKHRIRQELHYIERFGLSDHAAHSRDTVDHVVVRLGGQLAYAKGVEPRWVESVHAAFPRAFDVVFPIPSSESEDLRARSLQQLAHRIRAHPADRAAAYVPSATFTD
jgi:RNA-directed DNA polymerase